MKDPAKPLGKRFTLNYVEKGERQPDGKKARRRISALVSHVAFGDQTPRGTYEALERALTRELGENVSNLERFFANCTIHDVLDAITIVSRNLVGNANVYFIREVNRILNEEHLTYKVDAEGGVHPFVDPEFSRTSAATVAALSAARYATVLEHFENAVELLGGANSKSKAAIREVFLALETLFKLVAPGAPNKLASREIESFRTFALAQIGADAVAKNVTSKMIAALTDWVDGAHFYRHGQKEEEPIEPPFHLAVLVVSQGGAFLRWMASLDKPGIA
ncbi:hypothetical protein [Kumtagia ephedrae]|uniref:hypothetical protein n=1 Tax=Kumtagia ephedrae TaxID=2116701 RepID=UPI001056F874|nr:hypothetical protein [Mesorhizobium ephedrae]